MRDETACLGQPTGADGVGGEAEESVRSGTACVDPVRITAIHGPNAREGQSVEWTGEAVGA